MPVPKCVTLSSTAGEETGWIAANAAATAAAKAVRMAFLQRKLAFGQFDLGAMVVQTTRRRQQHERDVARRRDAPQVRHGHHGPHALPLRESPGCILVTVDW